MPQLNLEKSLYNREIGETIILSHKKYGNGFWLQNWIFFKKRIYLKNDEVEYNYEVSNIIGSFHILEKVLLIKKTVLKIWNFFMFQAKLTKTYSKLIFYSNLTWPCKLGFCSIKPNHKLPKNHSPSIIRLHRTWNQSTFPFIKIRYDYTKDNF